MLRQTNILNNYVCITNSEHLHIYGEVEHGDDDDDPLRETEGLAR